MRIGGSLFLIAIGAILKFGVSDNVKSVNLSTIGLIVMAVGILGLLISIAMYSTRRRTDVIHQPGAQYVDENGRQVGTAPARTTYIAPRDRDY